MGTPVFDSETINYLTQEISSLAWQYFKENNSQIIDQVSIYQDGNINVTILITEDEWYMYEPLMEDLINSCNTAFVLSNYMEEYSLSVSTKSGSLVGIYGEFQGTVNTDL